MPSRGLGQYCTLYLYFYIYFLYHFVGFSALSLPSVVGADGVCSAVGSGSVGSLAAAAPDVVRLRPIPSSVSLHLPMLYAAVPPPLLPPVSSAFPSCALAAASVTPLLPSFYSSFSCRPSCCSGHLSSFFSSSCIFLLLFPCLLSLLLFCLRVFPLPLLSSVLARRLWPSLVFSLVCLFYCSLFPFGVVLSPSLAPPVFSLGSSAPASSYIVSCLFCPFASSCSFYITCSLFGAYGSLFLG